jgi:hypothetical protein
MNKRKQKQQRKRKIRKCMGDGGGVQNARTILLCETHTCVQLLMFRDTINFMFLFLC